MKTFLFFLISLIALILVVGCGKSEKAEVAVEKTDEISDAKRLYIGNLHHNTTEADVEEFFQQVGTVVSCKLIIEAVSNRSAEFAFVEMKTVEEATQAVDQLNEQELHGNIVYVSIARPRK